MKSALVATVAWTFALSLTLLAVLVGLALMAPLLDTAWMRLQGSPATLLRWLVSGALALAGLGVIEWAWAQVGVALQGLKTGAGGPVAH